APQVPGRDPQLLPAELPGQTRRDAGHDHRDLVHSEAGGRVRDRLRGALRARTLPDAGLALRGSPLGSLRPHQGSDRRVVARSEEAFSMAQTSAAHDAHSAHEHAPQAFIWKYVFSKDHKVIGVQYYLTAMCMAWVAGALAMLVRLQLAWPEKTWPTLGKL